MNQQEPTLDPIKQRMTTLQAVECFVVAAVVGWLEWEIFANVMVGGVDLEYLLSPHLCVVGMLILWLYTLRRREIALHLPVLLTLTTALLGVFGVAGTGTTWVLLTLFGRKKVTFSDWYYELAPGDSVEKDLHLEGMVQRSREVVKENAVVSFDEIVSLGSHGDKIAVIAYLAQSFRPEYAVILRRALRDKDAAVRVQAATALRKVDEAFARRLKSLEIQTATGDCPYFIKLTLARHLDEYAYSGVLDAVQETAMRSRAVQLYQEVLATRPEDGEVLSLFVRALVRLEEFEQAVVLIDGKPNEKILPWYCECLYKLERFVELRTMVGRILRQQNDQGESQFFRVVQLWDVANEAGVVEKNQDLVDDIKLSPATSLSG